MTHSIFLASFAAMLLAKPTPTKGSPAADTKQRGASDKSKGAKTHSKAEKKTKQKKPGGTKKFQQMNKKGPKRGKGARLIHIEHMPKNAKVPGFRSVAPTHVLDRLRTQQNVSPPAEVREASNDPRVVATLGAAKPRDGGASIDFSCALVLTYPEAGELGLAMFPHRLIDACRSSNLGLKPGVTVSFPVTAGKFYTVECDSAATTEFQMQHKMQGDSTWSPMTEVRTQTPIDFIRPARDGKASIRITFDPAHNHIPNQSIRECRVSEIG